MSGRLSGGSLEDARHVEEIRIDSVALRYIPRIGPAAWAVYTYLIGLASQSGAAWPTDDEIAEACGISTYNARKSVEALLEHLLIGRHIWKGDPRGRVTYTILPVSAPDVEESADTAPRSVPDVDELAIEEPAVEFGDPVVVEPQTEAADTALVTQWNQETRERRMARQIFDAFVDALRLDPAALSDDERANLGLASRIVSEGGGQPAQIRSAALRFERLWPDRTLDPLDIANNWSLLVRSIGQPPSMGGPSETGDSAGA